MTHRSIDRLRASLLTGAAMLVAMIILTIVVSPSGRAVAGRAGPTRSTLKTRQKALAMAYACRTAVAITVSGTIFVLCILYVAAYRPVILIGFFFILFTLVWRTASTMFIDLAGPVCPRRPIAILVRVGDAIARSGLRRHAGAVLPFAETCGRAGTGCTMPTGSRAAPGMVTLSGVTIVVSLVFVGYCSSISYASDRFRCLPVLNGLFTRRNTPAPRTDG